MAIVAILTVSSPVQAVSYCPPDNDIKPCSCFWSDNYPNYETELYCIFPHQQLNDAYISNVLNQFLNPNVAPLTRLTLPGVGLTYIPTQICNQLDSLSYIDLAVNEISLVPDNAFSKCSKLTTIILQTNKIRSVGINSFNFNNNGVLYNPCSELNLGFNQITNIAPGAFQGISINNINWRNSKIC